MRLKGISTTTPAPLLGNSISLRTCADEAPDAPGVIAADAAAHCGPSAIGEFARTLIMTDLVTGGWNPPSLIWPQGEGAQPPSTIDH